MAPMQAMSFRLCRMWLITLTRLHYERALCFVKFRATMKTLLALPIALLLGTIAPAAQIPRH